MPPPAEPGAAKAPGEAVAARSAVRIGVLARSPLAVTGATGFVGHALASALAAHGRPVRALIRRPNAGVLPDGIEPVAGSLFDDDSLAALVEGAGTVVHVAGIVGARAAAEFHRVNVEGTARVVEAICRTRHAPRLLLVSSLAARRPELSAYAASKAAAEAVVAAADIDYRIVRPPAVYGPRDRATLEIFRQLVRGLLIVPKVADARFSLIYVDDLAAAMIHLVDQPEWAGESVEPDDGREGGYGWADLALRAEAQCKRRVRVVAVPRALAWCAALADEAAATVFARSPTLSRGKLRELCYPDWVCRDGDARALAGWRPKVTFDGGLALTLSWYRRHGWL